MDKVEEKIPRKDKLIRFIKIAQSNWQRATVNQSAAEMAYFLLLSLFPILLVLANTIPLLPIDANEVLSITSDFVPQDVFGVIEPIIRNYLESGSGGAISIGLLAALWSASRVITILRRVLDEVYGSIQTSNFIIGRVVSLFTMIGIVLVIGAAVFAFVFGDQILQFIQDTIGVTIPFIQQFLLLRWVVLVVILFLVFLIVYRIVPNHHLTMNYSYQGAIFATIGWVALTQGFSIYLNFAGGDAVANATFGTFIALMIFLYLSSLILLLGALINAMIFEWKNHMSVPEYENKKRNDKSLKNSGWTGYPSEADTVLLKRKLYKVGSLKEDEIKEFEEKTPDIKADD
ncbi:MAG: YihY/virulence factor BrkB family protein [Alkalibacterium gilvum]|uniref:Membrane protein n=1 Tax=Alkalibacterium gilvum TaxID=1130080 RepID=A0A1H6VYQ4_9LACT|nr:MULTISPECIES: YihY/virulence factor BrkB family protein [Alkalibacterium]MDN6288615.1 YihY/virulence factor BrkB family protein [Lactococcus lactis]MDN6194367.1 YihY/virulence factor BrkB family protein [Alkalibacterium sp.]MDN6296225.1 YihY/virulence factor BrkB family protein [Alkalibacterium sp.]MDN6730368.1 YihY/virulence factor BrkB family protein [Alkalibacterium sp.]SEJ06957.1 membrane protein [Alkalibacterium gilvum]